MSGSERISRERARQVTEEGYTCEHDFNLYMEDPSHLEKLMQAAACYIMWPCLNHKHGHPLKATKVPYMWPFDEKYWKPGLTRERDLEKSGALVAAALDLMERLSNTNVCKEDIELNPCKFCGSEPLGVRALNVPTPSKGADNFVVKKWVSKLSWKQQTVLLSALRGYDGVGKDDPSKPLVKALRKTILNNADTKGSGFMASPITDPRKFTKVVDFFENCHHYPLHWVMHFVHAAEIIGYKHPNFDIRSWWYDVYTEAITALHVRRELEEEMDERLKDNTNKPSVKGGTDTFGRS